MQYKAGFLRAVCAGVALLISMAAFAYKSPIEVPSLPSRLAAETTLIGVDKAGKRIVAVGQRGHIVYSDDQGKSWTQAQVPVSSDLVAVSFADEKNGWAVGHYGVVLHTSDGGANWTKQLDGDAAEKITEKYYAAKTGDEITPDVERATRQAAALVEEKNTRTLLDVAFINDQEGYVVGTFNRIFHTVDGGKTWTPLMDRTNNPREWHFYNITANGGDVYLAGEQGLVWHLNKETNNFDVIQTPYNGTLFGLINDKGALLVYGMRGSLLRSGDEGKSWERIQLDEKAGISGGTVLHDGRIALANQAGTVLVSSDHGVTFQATRPAKPMSYNGIRSIGDHMVALVGSEGVRVETLQ